MTLKHLYNDIILTTRLIINIAFMINMVTRN
jgi:hypothetical protein